MSEPAFSYKAIYVEALSLQTILDDARGTLLQGAPGRMITGLSTDSRAVKPGELFVALKGDKFDGHQFIDQCSRQGAGGAIMARGWVASTLPENFALIEVDDTLQAYQRIAAAYRKSLSLQVVAVTGSNGKTSTKDLAAAVLGRRYQVMKTGGNLNNHIGVPRTLLNASRSDEVAVLELGMNHPGEIAPLAAMAHPDTAIVTNIGSAHIEFMKTRAAIALEKGMLAEAVDASGHVILSAEDEYTASIAQRTRAQVVTVGFQRGELRAERLLEDSQGSRFQIVEDGARTDVSLPIPGRHMVINALLAAAAGRVHGVSLDECARGLEEVQLTKGRLELRSVAGLRIIDDSYNANPDSMIAALKTLARMPTKGRRIAVLGRMGELGEHSENGHRQVGDAAAHEGIDHLVTVGPEAKLMAENAAASGLCDVTAVANVSEAANLLADVATPDDLILLKGSRSAAMEDVLTKLTTLRTATAAPIT